MRKIHWFVMINTSSGTDIWAREFTKAAACAYAKQWNEIFKRDNRDDYCWVEKAD